VQIGHAFGLIGLIFWYGNILQCTSKIIRYKKRGMEYCVAMLAIVQVAMCIASQPLTTKTSHMLLILLFISSVLVEKDNKNKPVETESENNIVRGYIR